MSTKSRSLLFSAALLITANAFAQPAGELKPPADFRDWFHVGSMIIDKDSPLFKTLGGLHYVYVNSIGQAAFKKGAPYPERTIFIDDIHEVTVSDGTSAEGPRKGVGMMVKDSKQAATGGWAWQAWAGGDPNKPVVTDPAKQCFECHQARKDHDYVYSTYRP